MLSKVRKVVIRGYGNGVWVPLVVESSLFNVAECTCANTICLGSLMH